MRISRRVPSAGVALALVAAAAACDRPAASAARGGGPAAMPETLRADLAVVRRSRAYFYHHSVGANLLDGLARLDADAGGGRVRLASADEAAGADGPVLAHGGGGRNGNPKGKIDVFAARVRASPSLRPDLAFMKLCYADIGPETDVADLFEHYRRTLQALEREHPEVRFAHVSVPLLVSPRTAKATLKRLVGLEVWEDAGNVKRAEFNRLLRATFPDDPFFDLASVESTGPGGDAATFEAGGRTWPSLHPAFAEDSGHLNAVGRRTAGAAFAAFMADALRRPRPPPTGGPGR